MSNIVPNLLFNPASFLPFPDSQPFSIRSGATFDGLLEAMRAYLRDTVAPYIENEGGQAVWDANAAQLEADVNTTLNAAVQQVLNGSIPVSSALYWAILAPGGVHVVEKYGAVGDLVADDRPAVQAAIDAAATAYAATGLVQQVVMDRRYLLGVVDYRNADNSVFGATCLTVRSGVHLVGKGLLKVKGGGYGSGAYFRTISSTSTGVSNVKVQGLTFDANLPALPASRQCNNININGTNNVEVSDTRHVSANGVAIRVDGANNVKVLRNTIESSQDIGIQVSRFDGCLIANNIVIGAGDNAIDVYGENSGHGAAGRNWSIIGNTIRSCGGAGVFIETVVQGVAADNTIDIAGTAGIWINRINDEPNNIDVHDNIISNSPKGIYALGDMNDIRIHHNIVRSASQACIRLGEGGNISGIVVENNTLNGADGTVKRIIVGGNQASNLIIRKNRSRFHDGFTDVLDIATTSVNNVYETVQSPRGYRNDNVASGALFTFPVDANSSGKITIYAESGGGNQSIWQGAYVCNATKLSLTGAFAVNADPAMLLSNVSVDGGRAVKIQFPSTGSSIAVRWTLEKI